MLSMPESEFPGFLGPEGDNPAAKQDASAPRGVAPRRGKMR
jgi:hypothetical protein